MIRKLMICDIKIYNRTMLKNLIERNGRFFIEEADDGEELLRKLAFFKNKGIDFDLLFLDFETIKNNYKEILKKVRHLFPDIDIVICGGISLTDTNIDNLLSLGVKKFITKPYKEREVSLIFKAS